ncbi:uncharacterized protein LOC100277452 [Zea mays]|uniref:Uncharacterized protein n=1 Tax=Zea mays TaxID=4577 RepID=B6TUN2_MAIZE|nr:uncharacterized protein LOC100277452 [Zea mays]ACG40815.1 hypothetical protein [Zea mays]|eukprot:NP_001144481.1 uncharacterized protein LOC100277452 [Zea mays]
MSSISFPFLMPACSHRGLAELIHRAATSYVLAASPMDRVPPHRRHPSDVSPRHANIRLVALTLVIRASPHPRCLSHASNVCSTASTLASHARPASLHYYFVVE